MENDLRYGLTNGRRYGGKAEILRMDAVYGKTDGKPDGLYERIRSYVYENKMIEKNCLVIAGVSGGADSVFLFYMLLELRSEIGFDLAVLHVHHGIRGAEADRDAEYVRSLCGEYKVPCRVVCRNIPEEAGLSGMTLEETGRAARYEEFEKYLKELAPAGRKSVVAVAHHRNDAAETLIFNLARGTGVEGLGSIRPVRGHYIRPLLTVSREEIRSWLRARDISWCEDSTNADDEAVRNRIRHDIIPAVENEVNPEAVKHMAAAAASCAAAADFLRAEAEKRGGKYLRTLLGSGIFVSSGLLTEMKIMREEILRLALRKSAGSLKDFHRVHEKDLENLFGRDTGAHLDLPRGLKADRVPEGIVIRKAPYSEKKDNAAHNVPEKDTILKIAGRLPDLPSGPEDDSPDESAADIKKKFYNENSDIGKTYFGGFSFSAKFISAQCKGIPEKAYTKWFDYDKINSVPVVLRHRRAGDYLTVNASGGRKSLSDYLINEKVPRAERDGLVLLADGSEIIWIVGMRIGYRYRITDKTEHVLEVNARRDRKNE